MDIGYNYLTTIDATILKGRDFIRDSKNDMDRSVIVNERLVRNFGWDDPIGKRLILNDTTELFVIGVVKNLYLDGGLQYSLKPLILRYVPEKDYKMILVKTEGRDLKKVHDLMTAKWKKLFPDEPANISYLNETRERSLTINTKARNIFIFLGAAAMILGIIGLYNLVSLNIIKD